MQQVDPVPALFSTGPISCSQAVLDALHHVGVYGFWLVYRHMTGDWGDDENLATANRVALNNGDGPIVSLYRFADGTEIVITTMYACTPVMRQTHICLADEIVEDEQTEEADEFDLTVETAVEEY